MIHGILFLILLLSCSPIQQQQCRRCCVVTAWTTSSTFVVVVPSSSSSSSNTLQLQYRRNSRDIVIKSTSTTTTTNTIKKYFPHRMTYDSNHQNNNNDNDSDSDNDTIMNSNNNNSSSRRNVLRNTGIGMITSLFTFMVVDRTNKNAAAAAAAMIDNNNILLTNPILEQLRIWEQEEVDNVRYNGELTRGDAGNRGQISAYPTLLVPILSIQNDIYTIYQLLVLNYSKTNQNDSSSSSSSSSNNNIQQVYQTVYQMIATTTTSPSSTVSKTKSNKNTNQSNNNNKYDIISMKRTFNAYADNVYYNDPDRANLYLGGGATPKSVQSLAYLLRNEIIDNIDNLRAELQYQLSKEDSDSTDNDNGLVEVQLYSTNAYNAIQQYMTEIVPPNELQKAKELEVSNPK